ncbi:hypothetical protein Trco_003938 [Trichoderma cornu-damae]|uniref:Transmembrane protein n=1 Tax=Trichoderma cornu-damae TaxID=654480 RepID=A0A9P8QJQ9_9HYPO|nr:hypothetical protein Trco_003938 [Trichoderma cornu-damae]
MPIAHHIVLASGAAVAVSVAVATFIAIYEFPELRQYADDLRQRIVMAFLSMGDGIMAPATQPRFNRPEDAEGFFESRRGQGAEPGVDADEQYWHIEELGRWNAERQRRQQLQPQQLQPQQRQPQQHSSSPGPSTGPSPPPSKRPQGSTFDDFLLPDLTAEQGAYVFNTGADARDHHGGLRRRGEGARGSVLPGYSNPLAGENHIDADEIQDARMAHQPVPRRIDTMFDYFAEAARRNRVERRRALEALERPPLIGVRRLPVLPRSRLVGNECMSADQRALVDDEFMSAGQDDRRDVHATIQAWAQESSRDFYSPLPVTPVAPMSEPDVVSEGELTPTDSLSLVGSGEYVASDARFSEHDGSAHYMDVMSESEGMATPASWSEVGSVVSENDGPLHA